MDDPKEKYKFSAFDENCAFDDDGLFTYSSTEQVSRNWLSEFPNFEDFTVRHSRSAGYRIFFYVCLQKRVEELVREEVRNFAEGYMDSVDDDSEYAPVLCRSLHTRFLCKNLRHLGMSCSVKLCNCYVVVRYQLGSMETISLMCNIVLQ